jgi:hypothetical protein
MQVAEDLHINRDVIPNWAERPVRACPELAEGNLLTPSRPPPLKRKIKTRKTKN